MPARKKPAGTQQDRRPQRSVALEIVRPLDVPAKIPVPPAGLLVESKARWVTFWESQVAGIAQDIDHVVAERWILAYDEWRRSLNAVRRRRLVDGSMGQPVLNPLASWASNREAEMHKCEAEMGVGQKARHSLGITVGQAKLTAAELNKMTELDRGQDTEPAEDEVLADFEEYQAE